VLSFYLGVVSLLGAALVQSIEGVTRMFSDFSIDEVMNFRHWYVLQYVNASFKSN
jgi:hypothetical protein